MADALEREIQRASVRLQLTQLQAELAMVKKEHARVKQEAQAAREALDGAKSRQRAVAARARAAAGDFRQSHARVQKIRAEMARREEEERRRRREAARKRAGQVLRLDPSSEEDWASMLACVLWQHGFLALPSADDMVATLEAAVGSETWRIADVGEVALAAAEAALREAEQRPLAPHHVCDTVCRVRSTALRLAVARAVFTPSTEVLRGMSGPAALQRAVQWLGLDPVDGARSLLDRLSRARGEGPTDAHLVPPALAAPVARPWTREVPRLAWALVGGPFAERRAAEAEPRPEPSPAPPSKRRRRGVDMHVPLCPFELMGDCRDSSCPYQHMSRPLELFQHRPAAGDAGEAEPGLQPLIEAELGRLRAAGCEPHSSGSDHSDCVGEVAKRWAGRSRSTHRATPRYVPPGISAAARCAGRHVARRYWRWLRLLEGSDAWAPVELFSIPSHGESRFDSMLVAFMAAPSPAEGVRGALLREVPAGSHDPNKTPMVAAALALLPEVPPDVGLAIVADVYRDTLAYMRPPWRPGGGQGHAILAVDQDPLALVLAMWLYFDAPQQGALQGPVGFAARVAEEAEAEAEAEEEMEAEGDAAEGVSWRIGARGRSCVLVQLLKALVLFTSLNRDHCLLSDESFAAVVALVASTLGLTRWAQAGGVLLWAVASSRWREAPHTPSLEPCLEHAGSNVSWHGLQGLASAAEECMCQAVAWRVERMCDPEAHPVEQWVGWLARQLQRPDGSAPDPPPPRAAAPLLRLHAWLFVLGRPPPELAAMSAEEVISIEREACAEVALPCPAPGACPQHRVTERGVECAICCALVGQAAMVLEAASGGPGRAVDVWADPGAAWTLRALLPDRPCLREMLRSAQVPPRDPVPPMRLTAVAVLAARTGADAFQQVSLAGGDDEAEIVEALAAMCGLKSPWGVLHPERLALATGALACLCEALSEGQVSQTAARRFTAEYVAPLLPRGVDLAVLERVGERASAPEADDSASHVLSVPAAVAGEIRFAGTRWAMESHLMHEWVCSCFVGAASLTMPASLSPARRAAVLLSLLVVDPRHRMPWSLHGPLQASACLAEDVGTGWVGIEREGSDVAAAIARALWRSARVADARGHQLWRAISPRAPYEAWMRRATTQPVILRQPAVQMQLLLLTRESLSLCSVVLPHMSTNSCSSWLDCAQALCTTQLAAPALLLASELAKQGFTAEALLLAIAYAASAGGEAVDQAGLLQRLFRAGGWPWLAGGVEWIRARA